MAASERIKDDLAYVRGAVERTGNVHVPSVYLMWAAICLVGFSMPDFITNGWVGLSYNSIGWYWTVMGPAGFLASWWLSGRANDRAGQLSQRTGIRWALHWAAFGATGVLGIALALIGTCQLGGLRCALGAAAGALLHAGRGASGAPPAADRDNAGRRLPDNPVSAQLRVDSRRSTHSDRADRASLHWSAYKWTSKLTPTSRRSTNWQR